MPKASAMACTACTLRPTESTKVSWAWGSAMAIASPGKPPPVPTSITFSGPPSPLLSQGFSGQRLSKIWLIQ